MHFICLCPRFHEAVLCVQRRTLEKISSLNDQIKTYMCSVADSKVYFNYYASCLHTEWQNSSTVIRNVAILYRGQFSLRAGRPHMCHISEEKKVKILCLVTF